MRRFFAYLCLFLLAFSLCSCADDPEELNHAPDLSPTKPDVPEGWKGDPPEEDPFVEEWTVSNPVASGVFHVTYLNPELNPILHTPSVDSGYMVLSPAQLEWLPMEDYNIVCLLDGSSPTSIRKEIYDPVIKDGEIYYFKVNYATAYPSPTLWKYDISSGTETDIYTVNDGHYSLGQLSQRGNYIAWYEDDAESHVIEYNERGEQVAYLLDAVFFDMNTGRAFTKRSYTPSPNFKPWMFGESYAITHKEGEEYVTSLFRFNDDKLLFEFETSLPPCALDYDGQYVAYGVPNDGYGVYDVKSGTKVLNREGIPDWVWGLYLIKGMLVYGYNYNVYAIDLATKERIFDLKEADDPNTNCDYFFRPQVDETNGTILFYCVSHNGQKHNEVCIMTVG